jgi:DNA mismatch endonuclease (patch repair protein)
MPSSEQVSRNMKNVRVRDTGPEMAVRRLLFASGLRYRVSYRPKEPDIGRSSIDIAFPGKRLAIFIDGCFWHGCPEHGEMPKANRLWWKKKFSENKDSDARVTGKLTQGGWRVLRFWAHESPEKICTRILSGLQTI